MRHSVFPRGFSAHWYPIHGEKELGNGPSAPNSLFQRGRGCCPEEVKQWVGAWLGWENTGIPGSKALSTAEKTKTSRHLPASCRLPPCAELQEATQCHLPHISSARWSWFYPQLEAKRRARERETLTGTWPHSRSESPKGPEDVFICIYRYANSLRFIGLETFSFNTKPQIL